ncbi:MAG: hypothetical protein JNN07_20325 [Verrucomicrobiales bacterium]|nr:hypothetical protein [Verrucomicrobiales bacterium]
MSWFQLDPSSLANRSVSSVAVPSLSASVARGTLGFTVVSLAGFAPWAVFGRWFHKAGGELGMYIACAVVFIGLSGLCLHRLILGRGSLVRFYQLFSVAFTLYSVAWIAGWMALRGHPGSVVGLFAGTALMGWILVRAFEARGQLLRVVMALFVLNSVGYFVGGVVEGGLMRAQGMSILGVAIQKSTQARLAMLSWGLFYGLGFGAGLGLAFHWCQTEARALIASRLPKPPASI